MPTEVVGTLYEKWKITLGSGLGVGKIDGGHQVADTPTQLLDTHSLQV